MYIDSNIFIFAVIDQGEDGQNARKFVELIQSGKVSAFISPLVLDEVVWKVQGETDRTTAESAGRGLIALPFNWLDITYFSALRALDHYKNGLDPRDALHVAVMQEYGIDVIISEDSDLDGVKGIERRNLKQALKMK